ncbi:MAG: hypothetical protein AMJ59_27585 [Gammaproteobacteria bacterium SG8_31]|nr:MAG: hypothetical protein AMJ59_27585 [Gammaproteobacteria bacterium SG8_31]
MRLDFSDTYAAPGQDLLLLLPSARFVKMEESSRISPVDEGRFFKSRRVSAIGRSRPAPPKVAAEPDLTAAPDLEAAN